jgi:hypothetical protein
MAIRVRVLLSSVVVLTTMWLVGCGHYVCGITFGSSTCTPSGGGISQGGNGAGGAVAFGYFVDFKGAGMALQQLQLGPGGKFTDISAFTPPTLPKQPKQMVIVNAKFLYLASSDGTMMGSQINSTNGDLTLVPNSPYTVAGGDSITSDPAGKYVFVGDPAGQRISVFTVNADGSLTAVGSPFPTSGMAPWVLTTDGLGKYLYASDAGSSGLLGAFVIESTGALTPVMGNPFSIFPAMTIAGEPSGKYLLGVTGLSGDNHIHVLAIGPGGTLAEATGSPFTTVYPPFGLTVHPSGTWVYTFNGDVFGALNPLEGYRINSTGPILTMVAGSPFTVTAAGGPIEQSGKFMFGLGQSPISGTGDSTVTPYNIDTSTGILSSTLGPQGFPGTNQATYVVTDAP